ncbi:MAG: metalloenzyme [Candidatus Promineifilaceae bacterium]
MNDRSVLLFFMDGVGMGEPDPEVNPFVTADMPRLTELLGEGWYLADRGRVTTARATLVPTDANLNMPRSPQSATGQATILTGRNVSALIGQHYGPKPDSQIAAILAEGTLFQEVVAAGGRAALITPYPERFFAGIDSGLRLLSAVPLAAVSAGLPLMTVDDLRAGRAISPDFTGQAWRDFLGYDDVPIFSLNEAGRRIAHIAYQHHFSFFEHWPTDHRGHRGSLAEARQHLEMVDGAIGGILDAWAEADDQGLVIITSDHGNIEDKTHRQHTLNPVPTILVGQGHVQLSHLIHDLSDIATVVRQALQL